MNDTQEQAIIAEVIAFQAQDMMFTSLEIANEVKRSGIWVRSRDVGEFLRECFELGQMGDYKQKLVDVDVPGKFVSAFCYYGPDDDPADYTPRDITPITPDEFVEIKRKILEDCVDGLYQEMQDLEKKTFLY